MPETWTNEDPGLYIARTPARPADLGLGIRCRVQFGANAGREGWLWYGTLDTDGGVVWLWGDDEEDEPDEGFEADPRSLVVLFVDRPAGGT